MPTIKVFSTTTCVFCKMLKNYLTKNNFAYEEVLIDKHPEEAQTSFAVCGSTGVPCTQITLDDGR
jgi:glutaredoxin 3